ncbi:hypothetical protein QMK33_00305 [Hymenobacter sp. H14-R3]|uniref:hypothetical protein n=1 Tax=Hymenobacter sp. H14-R3 TaxID=3046308 RepID=UPI0024B91079|nr:hypothetical protein [Hymenobacter sp. H14-R3]MDJ0363575.1 hypothetical protein [Hymenobacter sp. H14-R3]
MTYHARFRITGIIASLNMAKGMPIAGVLLTLVLACASCASTRLQPSESLVSDTTALRQVQRLVSVAVPADSARLTTRIVFDEATHLFRPVTIFSASGHTRLAFMLDASGRVTATAFTAPYVAQVPVTDTDRIRIRTTKETKVVTVKAPLGRFVKFCIWFTGLTLVVGAGWAYLRFFTPLRLL